MNAEVISMGQVLGEARNSDEVLAIWRAVKELRQLSNMDFDELANMGKGQIDKIIGPTGSRNFGPKVWTAINWTLAIKWIAVVDLEQARIMEQHWEDRQRDLSNVRPEPARVSKQIIERAKPHVFKASGALGGMVRSHLLTPKQRSEIARKGGKARWRRKRERERAAKAVTA